MTIRLAVSLPPPFKAPLGTDVWWIVGAVYLFIGARRRDPRVRLPVVWVALGAAIIFGTVAAPLMLVLGVLERSIIAFGVALILVVPHAAIAYALDVIEEGLEERKRRQAADWALAHSLLPQAPGR